VGKLRVVSYNDDVFQDRQEAGRLLGDVLKDLPGSETVVLGIPRGGMVVAEQIYRRLNSELDIVLARKIRAPADPELAIGSISEDGRFFLNKDLVLQVNADKDYIKQEKLHQLAEIKNRLQKFRRFKNKVPLKGKIVVVTDDGVATGSTMLAALWASFREEPKRLIAAIPVGARSSLELLVNQADEVIVLRAPKYLGAVSGFYAHFNQVSDEEVLEILQKSVKEKIILEKIKEKK